MAILETNPEKNKRLFALILTHHRLWGAIIMPYFLNQEINMGYYRLAESLSPFATEGSLGQLTPEEREVVRIIDEYSERSLFKLFSKDKNVKEFIEKISPVTLDSFIRPYIERRLFKCLSIARNEDLPVFFQKSRSSTIHREDELAFDTENAFPRFRFDRGEEQSSYSLNLDYCGEIVNLKSGSVDIICSSPCIIRETRKVIFVSDIDGSKLKPFLTKVSISIPKKTELKYFSGFVLNTINNYNVDGSGFEVIDMVPDKKPLLSLEIGLKGKPVMILRFLYEDESVYSSDASASFTKFEHSSNRFIYKRFRRDFIWEKKCRELLSDLGFYSDDDINFAPASESVKQGTELHNMLESVNLNFNELTGFGFVVDSKLGRKYNMLPVILDVSSRIDNDWFDVKAIVTIGSFKIPFSRLRKNILEGIREYELPDGTLAILPEAWFTRYRNIFEFGKTSGDSLMLHKQHFSLLEDSLNIAENQSIKRLEKLLSPGKIPSVQPPAGFGSIMRKYQIDGLNWLTFLHSAGLGGCLADDMGLGKTVQTLSLLKYNKENTKPDSKGNDYELSLFPVENQTLTSLVIVPASLIYNWENEIKRFVPDFKVYSYKGNQRKKSTDYFSKYDVILSSYHTIRQDVDLISRFNFHYIILDESQVIKNPASMLYRTVSQLNSDYKLVLTGTPVENSLTDLWTQLNFVNPGLLGDLAFFRREFAKPIEKQGDDEKESKLKKIIQPFILRRTKEMVAKDLPPVTEQTVFCDMTDEQQKYYEEEKSAVRNSILESIASAGREKSAIVVLQGLMKLRQLSNHPVIANEEYGYGSGKFETVLQDIESVIVEGHKILVFSSFVRHLNLYAAELEKKRISYSMLTGASTNRDRIVDRFQNDPENKVFLISLKAGGVGLNLTAADYVFILDPWWNPASEMQALNRAHRIGQHKSVFVYRYITSNSIEEKIVRLQEKKSKLADVFISSNNPLKDINIDEILNIIG